MNDNYRQFHLWLSKNKKLIRPDKDLGVIYSGFMPVTDRIRSLKLSGGDVEDYMIQMWEYIDFINKFYKKHKGKDKYQTLEDVLKKIKKHPEVKLQGKSHNFSSLFDYAMKVGKSTNGFMSKKESHQVWRNLSMRYAENCEGDVKIFKGVGESLKNLPKDKIMLTSEIPVLLKQDHVSAKTKKELKKYEKEAKAALASLGEMMRRLSAAEETVKKAKKV